MTAGMNLRFNIWRIENDDDDSVGGAVITGTILYYNVYGTMSPAKEEQLLLQQGLETYMSYMAMIVPGTLDIRERDEVQVTFPPTHEFYGDRFRVISSRKPSFTDSRSYIMLTLIRREPHDEQ